MSWHVECYNQHHNASETGNVARYVSRCDRPNCGRLIQPGQRYWARKYTKRTTTFNEKDPWDTEDRNGETTKAVQTVNGVSRAEMDEALRGIVLTMGEKFVDERKETIHAVVQAVKEDVEKMLAKRTATTVEIKLPHDAATRNVGVQHRQFPILLQSMSAGCNVWLAGPSGSGKTTAAINAAKALDLPFRFTGAVGDQYALTGYNDANGKYVRTPFREAWEHGGVFLWDEVDASDNNAVLAFNAALANDRAPFPDGIIEKHPKCVLVAAANTWGHGATAEYVGRAKMDAAFLKRFVFLSWEYDEGLEMETAPNPEWTRRVQLIRKRVQDKKIKVMITPRESYLGAKLLAAGIPQDKVEEMTLKSGMQDSQWSEITSAVQPRSDMAF